MAAGVPETEVYAAADAVLSRGERPTVERVRTELGRGSPARVGQLLEQWWEQLAQRLKGHALLPELPGDVAQAFAEAWRLALIHAGTAAETALVGQQNALFAEQTSLTQERKLWEIALAEAQSNVAEAAAQLTQSEAQLRERQVLVDQLLANAADLQRQRGHLQEQAERRDAELAAVRAELATAQAHIRTVEDRAHQRVDQARQEVRTLAQQQERARREQAKQVAELTLQRDAMQATMRSAEQAAAHQTGRVSALETTLQQLQRVRPANKRATKGTSAPSRRRRPN